MAGATETGVDELANEICQNLGTSLLCDKAVAVDRRSYAEAWASQRWVRWDVAVQFFNFGGWAITCAVVLMGGDYFLAASAALGAFFNFVTLKSATAERERIQETMRLHEEAARLFELRSLRRRPH